MFISGGVSAQTVKPLSAEESDPAALGWMKGFPPPAAKLIMQPESDLFSFPKLRWTVCHIRELMPTKQVSRGVGPPTPLKHAIKAPHPTAIAPRSVAMDESIVRVLIDT